MMSMLPRQRSIGWEDDPEKGTKVILNMPEEMLLQEEVSER